MTGSPAPGRFKNLSKSGNNCGSGDERRCGSDTPIRRSSISSRITRLQCPIGEILDVVPPTPPVTFGQCRSYPAHLVFFRYTPRTLMLLFTPAAPNYMPV